MPDFHNKRDAIVIGASLGGMEALKKLFATLPPDLPAALFVVWHLPPESLNLLPEILQRVTDFPVVSPEDGDPIVTGRAYIARPDQHLVIEAKQNVEEDDGAIVRLMRSPKENRFRPSVDVLFRSAAVALGSRVIGVILTGALDDGASGLYAIKQCGGLAIVQDPLDAECPNMPISAMRAVQVDHTAPIADMGKLLAQLVHDPAREGVRTMDKQHAPDERMRAEVRIALEDNSLEKGVTKFGEFSPYTCPECHGMLVQMQEGNITRFRCHTGHAYTLDALLSDVTKSAEDALWNALRTIQETEMIIGHIAEQLRSTGQARAAEALAHRLSHATYQAHLLRQAITQNEVLSPEKLES